MAKKEVPAKPEGCRRCKGRPWIETACGMSRCDCPSGVWLLQRERERRRKRYEVMPVSESLEVCGD